MREYYIHSGKFGFEVRSVVTIQGKQSVHTHAVWLTQPEAERHLQCLRDIEDIVFCTCATDGTCDHCQSQYIRKLS